MQKLIKYYKYLVFAVCMALYWCSCRWCHFFGPTWDSQFHTNVKTCFIEKI